MRRRGLALSESPLWRLPPDDAVQGVLDGRWQFFIELGVYDTVNVIVATSPTGGRYLKTEIEIRGHTRRLLFLPQCR